VLDDWESIWPVKILHKFFLMFLFLTYGRRETKQKQINPKLVAYDTA